MKVLTVAIKAYRLENGYGSLVVKLQRSFTVETQMICEVEAIKGGWGAGSATEEEKGEFSEHGLMSRTRSRDF